MAKILLVEDEFNIRKNLKLYLVEKCGHDVIDAHNGLDALEKIKNAETNKSNFDLVITDNQMPGIKGSEIIQLVKKHGSKLIFISGNFSKKDVLHGRSEGADKFLVKPFNLSELETAVVDCLFTAMKEKENAS